MTDDLCCEHLVSGCWPLSNVHFEHLEGSLASHPSRPRQGLFGLWPSSARLYNYSPILVSHTQSHIQPFLFGLPSIFSISRCILAWPPALHRTFGCIFKYSLMVQVSPEKNHSLGQVKTLGIGGMPGTLHCLVPKNDCCWFDEEIVKTPAREDSNPRLGVQFTLELQSQAHFTRHWCPLFLMVISIVIGWHIKHICHSDVRDQGSPDHIVPPHRLHFYLHPCS